MARRGVKRLDGHLSGRALGWCARPLVFNSPMANLNAKISDIGPKPGLVAELNQRGFERVADMIDMPNFEILRIPGRTV